MESVEIVSKILLDISVDFVRIVQTILNINSGKYWNYGKLCKLLNISLTNSYLH